MLCNFVQVKTSKYSIVVSCLKNLAALLVIFKQRLGELHQLADLQTERCHENTQVTDHDIVVGEHELLVHLLDVVLHDVEHAHLGEVQRLGKLVLCLIIVSITRSEANSGGDHHHHLPHQVGYV